MVSSPPIASASTPPPAAASSSVALVPAAAARRQNIKPKAKATAAKGKTTKAKAKTKEPKRPKLKWRTRDSQNSQLYNLQLDINDLQQEIQHLQQMRDILSAQRLNRMDDRDGSYVKVVREYHRVFQHGFRAVVPLESGQHVNTMEFLSRVMDERVSIGRFVGLDMMRDQWTRYSTALCDLDLRYISSKVLPQMDYVTPSGIVRSVAMVSSDASYESIFTVETIEMMFPHLLQHRSVVEKLLGRKFRGLGCFDFVFDTNSHRVIGYDFRLDFFEAFARLLHDPEDLCLLFEGAKISEEFLIGDLNVYPQSAETGESSSSSNGEKRRSSGDRDGGNETAPAAGTQQHRNDPIVSKYSSQHRTAQEEQEMRTQQLHSKLTNILDPADRIPAASFPIAPEVPPAPQFPRLPAFPTVAAAAFPQQEQQSLQRYPQRQHYHAMGQPNRPLPWQLQLTSILHDAPLDVNEPEEEMKHEDNYQVQSPEWRDTPPRLPSISYFPASALGGSNDASFTTRSIPLLGKRSNPFGSEQFQSFPQ